MNVIESLRNFTNERDWQQFHDPKNLTMLAASEVGDLGALFRWVPTEAADTFAATPEHRAKIAAEIADIGIALLLLCDRMDLDLVDEIVRKIEVNRQNYPSNDSTGRADRK